MASSNPGKFTFDDIPSLDGSVAIVTGGSDGIGYITALQLALHGARVYILSRSAQKAAQAITSIKEAAPDKLLHVEFIQIDLLSFASVVNAVKQFKAKESTLDILINNAGIMAVPYALTEDGYETQWQTNYLSPFLLIKLLLPVLESTAARKTAQNPVRIVNLSSDAAFLIAPTPNLEDPNLSTATSFLGPWKRYSHSKLAVVLLTHHLHTRFARSDPPLPVNTYSLHPGFIESNLQAADPTWLGKIVRFSMKWLWMPGKVGREDGARTTLACATGRDEEILRGSGGFFRPFGLRDKQGDALVEKCQEGRVEEKLWEASERMVREKGVDV